jgi:hypothetical protein
MHEPTQKIIQASFRIGGLATVASGGFTAWMSYDATAAVVKAAMLSSLSLTVSVIRTAQLPTDNWVGFKYTVTILKRGTVSLLEVDTAFGALTIQVAKCDVASE